MKEHNGNLVPLLVNPTRGCQRCGPQNPLPSVTPPWFYRSRTVPRQVALPGIDPHVTSGTGSAPPKVTDAERLIRVQDWLRRNHKGHTMIEGIHEGKIKQSDMDYRSGDSLECQDESKTGVNMTDQFPSSMRAKILSPVNKIRQPNQRLLLPKISSTGTWKPSSKSLKTQEGHGSYNIGPLDMNSQQKTSQLRQQGPGILPGSDLLRNHYDQKTRLKYNRRNRSFTSGMRKQIDSFCRKDGGAISRPYRHFRSLADRQKTVLGREAWFARSEGSHPDVSTDIRSMQRRTYELHAKLKTMLRD